MIPDDALSDPAVPAEFLSPDSKNPRLSDQYLTVIPQDWEMGGIGLGDSSRGSLYQTWQFRYYGGNIEVGPDPDGPWTTLLGPPDISNVSEISGAFDTNMAASVAFVDDGVTKLWWYDSSVPGRVISDFPGCTSPRLTLDDKRDTQRTNADILFFYLRDSKLYYRQQRDRFATERLLCDSPPKTRRLGRVGMSVGSRVQIEFLTWG